MALLIAGLSLLAFWVWSIQYYASDSQRLREQGASTGGRVVKLRDDTRETSGAAKVAYHVGDHAYAENVDLGSDVENYRLGQEVVVHFDRSDPRHMTIDDVDNQPIDLVWLQVFTAVAGLALTATGVAVLVNALEKQPRAQGPLARVRGHFD